MGKVTITLEMLEQLVKDADRVGNHESVLQLVMDYARHVDSEAQRLGRLYNESKMAVSQLAPQHTSNDCVVQEWVFGLPLQQQSVLIALRGPDGTPKETPFKRIVRAYRASVIKAALYGRAITLHEDTKCSFLNLNEFADMHLWSNAITECSHAFDAMNIHYFTHLMYGAQILAYKHPDADYRLRWHMFYMSCCTEFMPLQPESMENMDKRLNDWNREHWDM